MEISADALVPDISFSNVAFISGALLMFSGIEISAIHSGDVENPGRTIPRSNLIAVALCFLCFAPVTLALAVVIPSGDINIVTGLIQSGEAIFDQFNVGWMTAVLAFLLVTGLAAALVQILGGPSRGLVVAGRVGGNLPPALQKENRNRMPVVIILGQAAVSSVLALGYGLLGSVQNAWFLFAIIQTNMTLIMYGMMLVSLVKLRISQPDTPRPYRIPGKWVGLVAVIGVGLLVCLLGLIVSMIPTEEATGMSTGAYVAVVVIGTGAFLAMPFLFWLFRKPSWKVESEVDALADTPDPEALAT
ncbi:MAG: APC family permease [Candidatus Nanopelagicales bacterium]